MVPLKFKHDTTPKQSTTNLQQNTETSKECDRGRLTCQRETRRARERGKTHYILHKLGQGRNARHYILHKGCWLLLPSEKKSHCKTNRLALLAQQDTTDHTALHRRKLSLFFTQPLFNSTSQARTNSYL